MKRALVITVCLLIIAAAPFAATDQIELAPPDVGEQGIEIYLGAPVVGVSDEELGEIRDFLAGERTSRLAFAVVSSGGVLGLGNTLRLVPIRALQWSSQDERFTINVSTDEWRELLTISEQDFEEHRIAITGKDPDRREPRETATTATSTPAFTGSAAFNRRLMRVGALPGTDVQVLDTYVGEIEDVILDLRAGRVRALLDPDREYAGKGNKVLVPLRKFVFAERGERLAHTTLTRSDFNVLYASWHQTTGPRQPPAVANQHREQRGLPPLGDPNPVDPPTTAPAGRINVPAAEAASRIRELLHGNISFADAEATVSHENGIIVLEGVAADAAERRAIGQVARDASGDIPVENRLRIQE